MPKPNRLWIAVDVDLLDPAGNKFGLDDAGIVAYQRCLAWAKRQDTEGKIPLAVAERLLNGTARALEAAGLIATDDDDQLVICDWHKWYETKAQVAERRAAERERQRLFREKRGSALSTKAKRRGEERSDNAVTPPGVTGGVTRDSSAPAEAEPCRHGVPGGDMGNWGACFRCTVDPDGAA